MLEVRPGRHQALHLVGEDAALLRVAEVGDDLADREHADRDDDEADAVGQLGDAEREALHAGVDVGADDAEQQPHRHHGERLHHVALRQHRGSDQPHQHQREIFRRAEFQRELGERRAGDRDQHGAEGAGDERADRRRMASAGPARPCRAIW
jgi:hypothetical protein